MGLEILAVIIGLFALQIDLLTIKSIDGKNEKIIDNYIDKILIFLLYIIALIIISIIYALFIIMIMI